MDLRVLATSGLAALVLLPGASAGPGATARISVASSGAQADSHSLLPAIDGAGWIVAFYSDATNLVAGDTNNARDVFVRDRQAGTTVRVSVDSGGMQANSHSFAPAVSRDGRMVAFHSDASNLVAGDANNASDVFVHDRQSRTTTRVSIATGGAEGNGSSSAPALSADGRFVTFVSDASNLVTGDTNAVRDVFLHDRQSGTTTRISVSSAGDEGNIHSLSSAISDDGRFVAFSSYASNLVEGDTNESADVFVRDRQDDSTRRVSVYSGGAEVEGDSLAPAISADGRFVAYDSDAWLLIWGDTNEARDIFVYDRQQGVTSRISVDDGGAQGNGASLRPSLTADGRFVAFFSEASNLVGGDSNGASDVFLHDRRSGATTRVSVGNGGTQSSGDSLRPAVSATGAVVAFESDAVSLVSADTNGFSDVFVHEPTAAAPPPPAPPPARCVVPNVRWKKLAVARRSITAARCRVGRVRQARSKRVRPGRVISQSPAPKTRAKAGSRVNLVVSRGRR
jgi:Tol biopolymer transport system component